MRTFTFTLPFAPICLAAFGGVALAQSGAETIVLMPEGADLPDVVTRVIELPRDAEGVYIPAPAGVENAARGLAIANEAREAGRAFGEAMAAQAQENRENNTRGGRPDLSGLPAAPVPPGVELPTLPEVPADLPSLPEVPAAPPAPELPDTPATPPGRS